jgi:hypothetical protein
MMYLLGAPNLDNTRQDHLLWVVGNEQSDLKDGTTKMAIQELEYFRCCHSVSEWFENVSN